MTEVRRVLYRALTRGGRTPERRERTGTMTTTTATAKPIAFYVYPSSGVEKFRYTNKAQAIKFAQMGGGTVQGVCKDGSRYYI